MLTHPFNNRFLYHATIQDFTEVVNYFEISISLFGFAIFLDGAYERSMTVCPPPLTMITFSILEIIMFLVDIIHFR